jgi:hypothetical protein
MGSTGSEIAAFGSRFSSRCRARNRFSIGSPIGAPLSNAECRMPVWMYG